MRPFLIVALATTLAAAGSITLYLVQTSSLERSSADGLGEAAAGDGSEIGVGGEGSRSKEVGVIYARHRDGARGDGADAGKNVHGGGITAGGATDAGDGAGASVDPRLRRRSGSKPGEPGSEGEAPPAGGSTGAGRSPEISGWERVPDSTVTATGLTAGTQGGESEIPGESVEVSGSVVIQDESGTEYAAEDGSFTVTVSGRTGSVTVTFSDGAFAARLPARTNFQIGQLVAGGRGASVLSFNRPLQRGDTLSVVARWLPRSLLRVVSEEEERDLTGVDVVAGLSGIAAHYQHPGQGATTNLVGADLLSPVDLSSFGQVQSVWVSAPGYSWRRVDLGAAPTGVQAEERVIVLERSAAVTFTFDNYQASSGARLRLRNANAARRSVPYVELTPEEGIPLRVEGLRPGAYHASVEIGDYSRTPVVLAEESFEVDRFVESEQHLALADVPAQEPRAEMTGTLALPQVAWDTNVILNIEPLKVVSTSNEPRRSIPRNAMTEVGGPGLLAWHLDGFLVGRYVLEVEPFQYRVIVDFAGEGSAPIAIEIPELADVRICAVDQELGTPVYLNSLSWQAKPPPGVERSSFRSAEPDGNSGCFLILAPVGEITISYTGEGVRQQTQNLIVPPGQSEHVLEVDVEQGVKIRFFASAAQVPISATNQANAFQVGGNGRKSGSVLENGALILYVTEPGTYQVRFSHFPGYQDIPDQIVDIPARSVTPLDLELTPK